MAVVIAKTWQQAADAAEAVDVDIEFLPTLIDMEESLASETLLYEAAGSNAVFA